MVGIMDVGGGLRGSYVSGIVDYLLENAIDIDYCLGVSAGSANLITYIAGQQGRLKSFYEEYSFEKKYMSAGNYLKKGMYIDLDYIYSDITNSDGKNPLDYEAVCRSEKRFVAAVTEAQTCVQKFFGKEALARDDFTLLKASCAIPVFTRRPVFLLGGQYFDGGVADPIPYKKAFEDGCDRLVVCLTLPLDYRKSAFPKGLVRLLLSRYPKIAEAVVKSHTLYNEKIAELLALEKQGKVLLLSPSSCCGIRTATKDREGLRRLYALGYRDAEKIEAFLR